MTTRQLKARLKQIRGNQTGREISEAIGVDPATWSRAENYGIVGPGLRLALRDSIGVELDPDQPADA